MQRFLPVCLLLACGPTTAESLAGGDSETTTTSMVDVPDEHRDGGWCCSCSDLIGETPACTPAVEGECVGVGLAWCELDEQGSPSACAKSCAEQPRFELCCSCADKSCYFAPVGECDDPEGEHSYLWQPCQADSQGECLAACGLCCDCTTLDNNVTDPVCDAMFATQCEAAAAKTWVGWCQPYAWEDLAECEDACAQE